MTLAGVCIGVELAGRGGFEGGFDLAPERRLIVVHCQNIVGLGREDGGRAGRVGGDGVDGDDRSGQTVVLGEALEEDGYGADLVGFIGHRLLAEHQPFGAGEGLDQMQGRSASGLVVARPRGLAPGLRRGRLDGDKGGLVRPCLAHEGCEGRLEQDRIDPVHEQGEPAPARRSTLIGQIAPEEVQMRLATGRDVLVVVAVAHRGAHREEKDLPQRIHHPPRRARILDPREMVQQRLEAGARREIVGGNDHGGAPNQGSPMESRFTQPTNRR